MDDQGWVRIKLIAGFNKVSFLGNFLLWITYGVSDLVFCAYIHIFSLYSTFTCLLGFSVVAILGDV